ncbi:MAG: HD domain-containing protein [Chitinispirillaceae bacterium]|nr:HD domain-containing protein [Chitinispirillaceae bacterium]
MKGCSSMSDNYLNPATGTVHPDGVRATVIELTGQTKQSRMVLNNQTLVVLYFPFRLGRLSRSDPKSTARQDLLLPDYRPFFVSRNHIVFDRKGDDIVIIDESSTCGTIVDNALIGRMTDGRNLAILKPGQHVISIGGPGSPYLFNVLVRQQKPSDFLALDGSIPDQLPQARMLYRKLCELEAGIIGDGAMERATRVRTAEEMARVMVKRRDLLDPLRCIASNPLCGADYLARHSVNVAIFMVALHHTLKTPGDQIEKIAAAALLHDIGMNGVDPQIVGKVGALSREEYAAIQKHTVRGHELIIGPEDTSELAASFAANHHERIDRSGYPGGAYMLSDHLRLIGFLDAFEALTHDRPHRQAFSPPEAVRMLTGRENSAFDLDTRKAFLNAFSFFPVSSIVKLSTGEVGQVVGINQGRPFAPVVRIVQSLSSREDEKGRIVDLGNEHLISIVKEISERELLQRYLSR